MRISFQFDLSPAPSPYIDTGTFGESAWRTSSAIRTAVLRRDIDTCQFCGFRSVNYQTCVSIDGNPFDIDKAVTACTFCEQITRADLLPTQRSGVLIWLPEVSQPELNRLMYTIYAARISQGELATRARELLDRILSRRTVAKERFGSDDPVVLVKRLHEEKRDGAPAEFSMQRATESGLRVMPLDRKIVREGDLEFNQFPQMLAFWRSRNGPLHREALEASNALEEFKRSKSLTAQALEGI